jgi:hypothetical protein
MDSNRLRAVTGKKRTMTVLERDFRSGTPEDLYSEVTRRCSVLRRFG